MERGRKQYRIAGILVLCALGACSGETVTGAPMAVPTSAGLTAVDTLALRMLSEQWGATTNGYRAALLRLHARHGDSLTSVNREHAGDILSMLARAVSDSTMAVSGERAARLSRTSGARFYYSGSSGPGIINPDLTTTQFWLPINPELYVETAVSLPAFYIMNRTTGSYVKLGQTYSIVSSAPVGYSRPGGMTPTIVALVPNSSNVIVRPTTPEWAPNWRCQVS
jgi:hypothetical protein